MSENLGNIYYTVDAKTDGLITGAKKIESATDSMNKNFKKTDGIATKLTATFAAVTAAISTNKVIAYADAWATVNNKLANSIKQNEKLADVTERVFNIAQNTRSSVDATASLYSRLERATRDYGTSATDLIKLTETINRGFIVSGATAQEAENAVIQLSQGLASGALRGEEFNSVNEQGNRLIVALADSLGKTTGEMRALAAQGKLTTDVVVSGLLKQSNTIEKEYNKTLATFAQNTQKAEQNLMRFVGESNTVKEVVAGAGKAIVVASENIQEIAKVSAALAAVFAARMTPSILAVTAAFVSAQVQAIRYQAALASMAGVSRVAAAATGVLSGSVAAFNAALALIGGPAGAAFLAAAAIVYYYTTAETAEETTKRLSGEVDTLSESFRGLNAAQRQVAISKLNTEMDAVRQKMIAANSEIERLSKNTKSVKIGEMGLNEIKISNLKKEVDGYSESLNNLSMQQQALFKSGLPNITNSTDEVKKSGIVISDEVKKITDSLMDERKQLTMTADGFEEYALRKELASKNASKQVIESAVAELKALQALRAETALMEQVDADTQTQKLKVQTDYEQTGQQITADLETPAQKAERELAERLEVIRLYNNLETIEEAEKTAIGIEAHKAYTKQIADIDKDLADKRKQQNMTTLSSMGDFFGNMADISKEGGKKSFDTWKVMASAQAGISAALAIINTMASVPFPYNVIASAGVGALAAVQVAKINSQQYGGGKLYGGSVQSGTMYPVNENGAPELFQSGNKQYLMPNSRGEVISNKDATSSGASSGETMVNFTYSPNIQALDSDGVATILAEQQETLWNLVQRAANERGRKL